MLALINVINVKTLYDVSAYINSSWAMTVCASVHYWTTPASQNTLRK